MDLQDFSKKYYDYQITKKKIRALLNFSECALPFSGSAKFEKACELFIENNLSTEAAKMIDELLVENNLDYLSWSCKTFWVKKQILMSKIENVQFYLKSPSSKRLDTLKKQMYTKLRMNIKPKQMNLF